VAEIDHTQDGTVGPVAASWLRHQLLAGAFVAIFLGMTFLALRDPVGRINTGVPFAASAVPAGYSLIDEERLHAVEEVYRRAHERVARLEAQLSESEGLRRHLEGDLQRALSTASTGSGTTSPATAAVQPAVALAEQQPAAPVSRPPATRPPMAPNTIVTVPRSEVLGESWTAAAVTAEAAIPTKPKRHLLKRKAEPVAGAVTTAPATDPGVEDATAHEAVLETFIRLTESDRQSHEAGPVDAGAVRAALARTAARKKPGGTKLQPHEEPKEVRGGGPRREDG
jgi:hypothetical protein